ncbi:MAG: rod shape-determining protein MreC [Patescibacteria group bacterium]|nr:rod shape-determining protein MreC [Patescibacteria group bacterium]
MKKNGFLITIIVILILGFILSPFLSPIKSVMHEITYPVAQFFTKSNNKVSNFFRLLKNIRALSKDNKALADENTLLKSQISQLQEVSHENDILKKEINFSQTNQTYELIPAQIIGRSPSGFLQSLKINKGKNDGIALNKPVLSLGFMIGKISQVDSTSAEIELIANYFSLLPIVLQNSRGTGLLKGGLNGLIIEDIALDTQIQIGENVLTSGLGGEFPAGLPIGTIEKVVSMQSEIFQKASVKSPIELGKLELVFIIK